MRDYLDIGSMSFSSKIDKLDELEVHTLYSSISISKDDIPRIIEHLQRVLDESNRD